MINATMNRMLQIEVYNIKCWDKIGKERGKYYKVSKVW